MKRGKRKTRAKEERERIRRVGERKRDYLKRRGRWEGRTEGG